MFRRLAVALLLLTAPASAQAPAVPLVLSHEGMLLDSSDTPASGVFDMTFTIHARLEEAAGQVAAPLWSATYKVAVVTGRYGVQLGDLRDTAAGGTPLPATVFVAAEPRFLGVRVGSDELVPRLELASVPFAFVAGRASRADRADLADLATNATQLGGAAAADYLKASLAEATYQPIGDYLTTTAAAQGYQPVGDYVTAATAASTYQAKGDYLTTAAAQEGYQAKGDYLTTAAAASAYQAKGDFLTTAAASSTYQAKGDYVTTAQAAQFAQAGQEVFVRGATALAATGSTLTGMAAVSDGLAISAPTLPDLEVVSGQTFTAPNEVATYRNITVRTGGRIVAATWDGTNGGKIRLRATGTITVETGGSIDVTALGYRGGVSSMSRSQHGQQGESYTGVGVRTNCTRNAGGGGGGQTDAGNYGQAGAGGGYGTAGAIGARYVAPGCDAEGGTTYGDEDLTTLHLGSGGGSGGTDGDKSGRGGDGGRGGGGVSLEAAAIVVSGSILARGQNGTNAYVESDNGGGGGGAGGSVLLWANSIDLRSGSTLAVDGGAGGLPIGANAGGKGGDGRILLKAGTILQSGTLTGAARKVQPGALGPSLVNSSGTYVSPALTLPAGTQLRQVDVFAVRSPETLLAVEACVAASEAGTAVASCWQPVASSGVVDPLEGAFARVRVTVIDRGGGTFRLRGLRLLAR